MVAVMNMSLMARADGVQSLRDGESPDAAASEQARPDRFPPKRHDGNFVTGCLVGGAIASLVWAAIGFAVYRLL